MEFKRQLRAAHSPIWRAANQNKLRNIEICRLGLNQARLFLFTCNLHKNGCILPYFRMKIDRSLPAIVKQIISPRAKLIHKMFQMGTITYSFTLIDPHSIHLKFVKVQLKYQPSLSFSFYSYLELWIPCFVGATMMPCLSLI